MSDAPDAPDAPNAPAPSIEVSNLTYNFPDGTRALSNISLSLPAGSRTLLIGANGAGKTTLLRLLSGKRLAPSNTITIGGFDPFKHGLEGVTYLGMEWVLNPIVRNDISVTELLRSVGGDHYPARRDQLVRILDIDVGWRMHAVSDGERRRVQLAMGLLRPWSILLLDEVTVDLDVLARMRFLQFLKEESESRACTVVYATHILEGLQSWATHLVRVSLGGVRCYGETKEVMRKEVEQYGGEGSLLEVVMRWLEQDLEERGPRNGGRSQALTYENVTKVELDIHV
ncbi:ABC transporter-like protein [Sphaerosporella brunnea]|uniref:ABC transporter-like protein n=1 Tax=Sphaerosporella brunnea TaxID=1250544 RepID=A0A5J5F7T2_9PEZI|nr:ABC transporter-like protein [Sphaerosporella brunnea]